VSCFFQVPLARRGHYFCSEFVAQMLEDSGAAELAQPPALTRPMDLCALRELRRVLRGRVGALAA